MRGDARFAACLAGSLVAAFAGAAPGLARSAPSKDAAADPKAAAPQPMAPKPPDADAGPDVWIFSGVLPTNNETFSGTLVSSKGDAQFELRLADGATCDGTELTGDVGLVRLSEIPCTDGRSMRALFVPQGGQALKVFGHIGDDRFVAAAHLLGTEPPPEAKQTAQPTVPQVQPPVAPPAPSAPRNP